MYILPFQEISWKGKTAFRSAPRSIIIFIHNQNSLSPTNFCLKKYFRNRSVSGKKNNINPEKPDVPLNKNDAFQKVQKRHVQEKR